MSHRHVFWTEFTYQENPTASLFLLGLSLLLETFTSNRQALPISLALWVRRLSNPLMLKSQ